MNLNMCVRDVSTSNTIKCCALKLIISLIKLCHVINISCANFRPCHLSKTVTFLFRNLGTSGPCMLSFFGRVRLFATLWTVALQAPLSMGFSRQKYWSGLPCSSPGDLPCISCTADRLFTHLATWEAHLVDRLLLIFKDQRCAGKSEFVSVIFGQSMKCVKTPIFFRTAIFLKSDAVILFIFKDGQDFLKVIMYEILWQIQLALWIEKPYVFFF